MEHTPTSFLLFSGKKDAEKNDKRFKYLSEQLIGDGKKVFLFNKNSPDVLGEEVTADNIKAMEDIPLTVILSFFLTADEKAEIFSVLPRSSLIFGGKLSSEEASFCKEMRHIYTDVLSDDTFCKENAVPTAEAALAIAITETPFTLRGKNALILGYGRVAKETAAVFQGVGMNIVCAVRREELFDEIRKKGYGAALITEDGISDADMKYLLKDFKVIINTVPPPGRITKKHVCAFCPDVLFIDLAPCGTVDMIKAFGINAVNAPSLPGRISPQSGAEYIYNAVQAHTEQYERRKQT